MLAEVTVSGPNADLDRLKSEALRAFVDVSGITLTGEHRLPLKLYIDDPHCQMVSIVPEQIDVLVKVRSAGTPRGLTPETPDDPPEEAPAPVPAPEPETLPEPQP
jgi:hypothetical protein